MENGFRWRSSCRIPYKRSSGVPSEDMMKRLGFLLLLASAAPAWAQDYEAAGKHFATAQELYGKGKFVQAAAEYQAAYDITKDPILMFNVAEAFEKGKEWNNAVKAYRRYIAEAPTAA